ncbi:MAG: phosphatidylglycerophosphatase A [Cardiobacteriaceae bacterium]|nr:phosphatidylglycerophosphatase A [Cardiobacteriaceae bacterium]
MNSKNPPNFRPHTFATLCKKPIHFFAFGLGSGLIHPAPGTWGTLAATLLYFPLSFLLTTPLITTLFILLTFALGCWFCHETSQDLGVHDFGEIVWDEFVGIWLVLVLFPPVLWNLWGLFPCYLTAFLLFRFFDIIKPPPIRWLDLYAPGGFGIMIDDILAALFASASLWIIAIVI